MFLICHQRSFINIACCHVFAVVERISYTRNLPLVAWVAGSVRPERKISISMKNLVLYSRKRAGKTMAEKLAAEIVDAYNQQGAAFKRKEEMHRMAEANKAFAHFRF